MIKKFSRFPRDFSSLWPLWVALALLSLSIYYLWGNSLGYNQGHLVYALDDGYIHMAVAKNIAQSGVWGITHYEFSSTTSSPLWTLLLAGIYRLFGVSEIAPFVLNLFFVILTMGIVFFILRKLGVPNWVILPVLISIGFAGTLPLLVFIGMEHALEVFLYILYLYLAGTYLSDPEGNSKEFLPVLICAVLLVAGRYEGFFIVGVSGLLCMIRKDFFRGALLLFAGGLPILVYGIFSLAQGGLFLPNSILLKGIDPATSKASTNLVEFLKMRYETSRDVIALAVIGFLVLVAQILRKKKFWDLPATLNLLALAGNIFQTLAVGNNYFYRYEANLVVSELMVLSISIVSLVKDRHVLRFGRIIQLIFLILLGNSAFRAFPLLFERAVESYEKVVPATTNIFEQQYQMGLFLREFYTGKVIAANDIGAINYLADIQTVDLYGLSTQEVANLKLAGDYSTQKIQELVLQKQVDIALVYDQWYDKFGGLPREWRKVGEWEIRNNVVCGGSVVSFYAINKKNASSLWQNLEAFDSVLPRSVIDRLIKIK